MRIVHINPKQIDPTVLAQAVAILAQGGVVAFPTETAYGLAADPRNFIAVEKIYAIKGRERHKPLPLIVADAAVANQLVKLSPELVAQAQQHWPGPLTIVAPLRWLARWRYRHLAHNGTAAIRVSPAVWATAMAAASGGAITSTSANLSGQPSLYSGQEVISSFSQHQPAPDLVLDAGQLTIQPPSTIIEDQSGKIIVLRQGAIAVSHFPTSKFPTSP